MIQTKILENGVRIVVEEIPQLRSVSLGVYVKTGSVDEDPRYLGISHFIEHMLFKGSETRSAHQIVREIDRTGGEINAFTGKEATCYYVKTLAEAWKETAEVLCDIIEHPKFAKEEMDRERKVIAEEIRMDEDSPEDLAHEHLMELLFAGKPLAGSITGTPTSLRRITGPVIRDYHRAMYSREHLVVSVAGRLSMEEAEEYFSKQFLDLPLTMAGPVTGMRISDVGGVGTQENRLETNGSAGRPRIRQSVKDIRQTQFCLGIPTITLTDPRSYALQVLNGLFGASDSSRLFQSIREERGLAYTAYSDLGFFTQDAYFEIYAGVSRENLGKTLSAVREEVWKLRDGHFTEEEVHTARMELMADYVFSGESAEARMVTNGKNLLLHGKVFQPEEVLDGFRTVTMEDLEAVKAEIASPAAVYLSVVSDRRMDRRKLDDYADYQ